MKSESEMSDKEWRQMRRQLTKLEFEPVPETPALVPRSLYGDCDKCAEASCNLREEAPEVVNKDAAFKRGGSPGSPKCRSAITATGSSEEALQKPHETEALKIDELPSTSMAVSPLNTNCYRVRETRSNFSINDAEIAALDAQMAAAQENTRRSIMSAFIELRAKTARSEVLERTKISAAHTNEITVLQNKVKELNELVLRAQAQQERSDLVLDRYSEFAAKHTRHNQKCWIGERSLAACFRAWITITHEAMMKRHVLRRVVLQFCKRQLTTSFHTWKEGTQKLLLHNQLHEQQSQYELRIVEVVKEYQLKLRQLQQDVDEAKRQVAESQKCRQKLEEDLRLVFLRGVSAMNIEALTVFGSNHKQNFKMGEPMERIALSPCRRESSGNQATCAGKDYPPPATGDLNSPEMVSPPKKPTQKPSLDANAQALTADEIPTRTFSSTSPPRPCSMRTSCSVAASYPSHTNNTWPRTSSGLRSAEMIRQHEFSAPIKSQPVAHRSSASLYRPASAPSPTKKSLSSQPSTKYQVEMQYMRSTMAASAAKASGGGSRPVSVVRSPLSSARSRRS